LKASQVPRTRPIPAHGVMKTKIKKTSIVAMIALIALTGRAIAVFLMDHI
jgi:hypothetical protein